MALALTTWLITSDVTPEIALRSTTSEDEWVLSWLPDRSLTLEQAVSGMVLDEILSDPELADGELALELAAFRAAELGVTLREVVLQLAIRMAQRDLLRSRQNVCIPAPHHTVATDTPPAGPEHCHSRQCRCRPQTAAGRA
ncbi:hypothetical protein [Nocardia sp. NBC_01327]|uniref:hypothetical protein n=1 Tax=Nocardia sp. NBC_01327 TaxID=2903593 RepID=UPI002E148879|nr:hypothetical protein OG326_08945 [Nocardia sp. NBC_01327]